MEAIVIRAIVLAAGKGTRMKSGVPKVLHEICGRPMLWFVLRSLRAAGISDILVVTNRELEAQIAPFGASSVVQEEQGGTGHAVKVALEALPSRDGGRVIVASGDMPLVGDDVFRAVAASLDDGGAAMSLVTVRMPLASNFGRIVRKNGGVERIVEVRDATPAQLQIEEMNAAIYAFDETGLREAVSELRADNAQKEYYLTDTVAHFVARGKAVRALPCDDPSQMLGVNDRVELALARREMNERLCAAHMRDGVTIVDPATTYLEPELRIGRDTVIYPNTSIGRLSEIGERCIVGGSRLSNAKLGDGATVRESVVFDSTVGEGASVGPFAHVRGEAVLGEGVRVGNFVEIKKSKLARGVKASHLTYLGDATIGENTNVGAGTITANYDGVKKNPTTIGKDVRIGSNSSLVAPVTIGDGALTGAGSVVTKNVGPGERVAGNPARPLPKK
jgi:bifunctional UDP-N-acetylglucosamine pyrophosphorylase / glucosamine-1-phosphate N-acetyltransferase